MKNVKQINEIQDRYAIFNNVEVSIHQMLPVGFFDFLEQVIFQEIPIEKTKAFNNCNEYLSLAFCEAKKSDEIRDDNYIIRLLKMAKRQADKYYESKPESFLASA